MFFNWLITPVSIREGLNNFQHLTHTLAILRRKYLINC